MLTIAGAPDDLEGSYARQKELTRELLSRLGLAGEPVRLPAETDLLALLGRDRVALVTGGYCTLRWAGRDLRLVSDGDLVLPRATAAPLSLPCRFATDVTFFPLADLLAALARDAAALALWTELEAMRRELELGLAALLVPTRRHPEFELRRYAPGDTIIREGDPPDEVFELLAGRAEVSAGGIAVGEVAAGEIFGEVGFLADSARTATVRATRGCFVRVVTRQTFLPAIEQNPRLLVAIARTLAARLVAMNERVRARGAA